MDLTNINAPGLYGYLKEKSVNGTLSKDEDTVWEQMVLIRMAYYIANAVVENPSYYASEIVQRCKEKIIDFEIKYGEFLGNKPNELKLGGRKNG